MFLQISILLLISSQVFAEPAHPLISHEEAQYVAYTLMRATDCAGPTVEKLGRVFKNPFILNTNETKTVEQFVDFLQKRNQNRTDFTDEMILRQEQEDIGYFEDRKAILYYRTKQFQPEKFERVYNEQDKVAFKKWARKTARGNNAVEYGKAKILE